MTILYVYPIWKNVSWRVIAEYHIEQLRKRFSVQLIDENALPFMDLTFKCAVFLHPYFYPFQVYEKDLAKRVKRMDALIGMDVADSNRMSELAVRLTEYSTAMIVPSSFARDSYVNSGVRKPVYVIPHGVDEEIFNPKEPDYAVGSLGILKSFKDRGFKILVSFIPHSPYRKGYDLLEQIFTRVRKERSNVVLALKDAGGLCLCVNSMADKHSVIGGGWISEHEKDSLLRMSDIYLHTSRGGGFEHPPLEALARGVPMIGAKGGSWDDYMPDWAGVESKPSGIILDGNPIHVGIGVEMLVDKAVDKVLHMLDNLEDYKAKTREYVNTVIRERFTWNKIGEKLIKVVEELV
jgi:glycosyltransferase involved in cell wall biosynthesis